MFFRTSQKTFDLNTMQIRRNKMAKKVLEVDDGFINIFDKVEKVFPRQITLNVHDAFMIAPEIEVGGEQKTNNEGDE